MFGIKGKLASTKQKVFKLFRSIGILRNEDPDVSSPNSLNSVGDHASEAELKIAEALMYWHELRKAEALLFWRRMMYEAK